VAKRGKSEGVVLGDVGGTNARFAILQDGVLGRIEHLKVADYQQFADALDAFIAMRADHRMIRNALFGVAGVVERERCVMTNNPWIVSANELRDRFGLSTIHIINDFEAVAWSLPHLAENDLRKIGGREPDSAAPKVVLGPGTGLGVAAYLQTKKGNLVVRSEGGHATLPSSSALEDAIVAKLRQQFGHVSAERALSGRGLQNLYQAIASLEAQTLPELSAIEITRAAAGGNGGLSRVTVDIFCALLGSVAGNLALSFGAQGGVYIAGGIAPHLRDYLPVSQFRSRFEAKGRLTPYLASIPTYLILHDDPAFVGLQWLALQQVSSGNLNPFHGKHCHADTESRHRSIHPDRSGRSDRQAALHIRAARSGRRRH
jgi:glucokinase